MRKDISEILEGLNSKDWSDLFAKVDEMAHNTIASRGDVLYRYIGEIDCPEEMLSLFATDRDVRRAGGKANWFICSDGTFFACGDATVEAIFEEGKNVDYLFPFEIERNRIYESLSRDEKIEFRIKLQGIEEDEAREIVCMELGISPYKNTYVFHIERTLVDDYDNSEKEEKYDYEVEADTEDEAYRKLRDGRGYCEFLDIGQVVQTGTRYSSEDNRKMREGGKSIFNYKGGTKYTIKIKECTVEVTEVRENEQ